MQVGDAASEGGWSVLCILEHHQQQRASQALCLKRHKVEEHKVKEHKVFRTVIQTMNTFLPRDSMYGHSRYVYID